MRLVQEVKDKFSTQDLGINAAVGAVSGALASRFFTALSTQGGVIAGAGIGSAAYLGQLLAGDEASPMRIVTAMVLSISLVTFALFKGGAALAIRSSFQIIPSEPKALFALASLNAFGQSMIIYFPILFPGMRTAPTLPTSLKDLFEMPSKQVRECHEYYEANTEAYTALPSKAQFGLDQTFRKEGFSSLSTSFPTTFDEWEEADLSYVYDQDWSFEQQGAAKAFQSRCYSVGLEPPKEVAKNFDLPRDIPTIAGLNEKQRRWFKQLFTMHPDTWAALSPAKQLAFRDFPEFTGTVSRPKSVEEVTELSSAGVKLFHPSFEAKHYNESVGLALIQRFASEGLPLPENIQAQLKQLKPLGLPSEVKGLSRAELQLYALLYQQDSALWDSLPPQIQWAFSARTEAKFPPLQPPTAIGEILGLDANRINYFYRAFTPELIADAALRYQLIVRFYESDLHPTQQMVTACIQHCRKSRTTSPLQNFTMTAEVTSLTDNQIAWFAAIYRDYREAWAELPLNYQVRFKNKAPEQFNFLTYTYPTSLDAVAALDVDATEALRLSFDISIMHSTGRYYFANSFTVSPLDDQKPELFSLKKSERRAILQELGKKFVTDPPKGFEKYITPPNTVDAIQALSSNQLQYWGNFFMQDEKAWGKLNLLFQVAYIRQALAQRVDVRVFPEFSVKDNELQTVATQGTTNHNLPNNVSPADNNEYLAIRYLFENTNHLALANWTQWTTATQAALKVAFGHLNLEHHIPVLAVAIPNHPADVETVNGMVPQMVKVYHENFHPSVFEGVNRDAIFDRFIAHKFLVDLGPLAGTLGLHRKLLANIDLSNMSEADKAWAEKVLVPADKTKVVWDSLSCQEQLVYRTECAAVNAGIPPTHTYKAPTLEEIQDCSSEEIHALHTFYHDGLALDEKIGGGKKEWFELSYDVQSALNTRFNKEKRAPLVTAWTMTQTLAARLTSEEGTELRKVYDHHEGLWHSYSDATQAALNTHFGDRQFVSGATTDSDRRLGYLKEVVGTHYIGHNFKEKVWSRVPNVSGRVRPHLTKRNVTILAAAGLLSASELTGLTNVVPDVILETGLSLTGATLRFATVDVLGGALGLGWSGMKWGGSLLASPFISTEDPTV